MQAMISIARTGGVKGPALLPWKLTVPFANVLQSWLSSLSLFRLNAGSEMLGHACIYWRHMLLSLTQPHKLFLLFLELEISGLTHLPRG